MLHQRAGLAFAAPKYAASLCRSVSYKSVQCRALVSRSKLFGDSLPQQKLSILLRYVTQQLFEEIGPSSSNLLDPHAGVFAVYCCLKIGGEFQSEADAKVSLVHFS